MHRKQKEATVADTEDQKPDIETTTWAVSVQVRLPKEAVSPNLLKPIPIGKDEVQAIVENLMNSSGLLDLEAMIIQQLPEGKGMIELAVAGRKARTVADIVQDVPEPFEHPGRL